MLWSIKELARRLSVSALELQSLAAHADELYKPGHIRKPGEAGPGRHIDRPATDLVQVQRRILDRLLKPLALPAYVLGGVPKKTILDNAKIHAGQPLVAKVDIRECFPSISDRRVFAVFKHHLKAADDVAALLTRLTTLNNHLPQGASTSTALANLALLPLHERVEAICHELDVGMEVKTRHSAWIDDIVFSGVKAKDALPLVLEAIREEGLRVRGRKVQLMPSKGRQEATGTVLNKKPSISKTTRKEIRWAILRAQSGLSTRARARVLGRIGAVKQVCREQGAGLTRLAERKLPAENLADEPLPPGVEWLECPEGCPFGRREKCHQRAGHQSGREGAT